MTPNPHRGSDFTEFMIEEKLMPTPRTDALRLKMAQLGWPSDGEPVAMLMASHGELERELAAERALADRLASVAEYAVTWDYTKKALDAWKEARREAQ